MQNDQAGRLSSIVYKPVGATGDDSGYIRLPLRHAQLKAGHGIEGDTKGTPGRQLNVMCAETVQSLAAEGFCARPGELGEQLIVAGIDIDRLPIGAQIQIGETACVELTEPRTGCGKFERHQQRRREEAAGRMGMMARVVNEGKIAVGDVVCVRAATNEGAGD